MSLNSVGVNPKVGLCIVSSNLFSFSHEGSSGIPSNDGVCSILIIDIVSWAFKPEFIKRKISVNNKVLLLILWVDK
jgi:hypothetical protein